MNCVVGKTNVNVITTFDDLEWSPTTLYYALSTI
jgi:hypothetical protein